MAEPLEVGRGIHELGQMLGESQMALDQVAHAVTAHVLEGHPELEGAKPTSLLDAVLRVPRQAAKAPVGLRAQIVGNEAERLAKKPAVADEDGPAFHRDR